MVIADLPRYDAARLEQETRQRPESSLALRRCHSPQSHVVENEVELAWCCQGQMLRSWSKLRPSCERYQRSHHGPPA